MRSIAELAAGFRDASLSPVAVARDCLDAIAAAEPALNAVATLLASQAVTAAEQAGRELRAGHDRGPLHGVPVAVKDLFAMAGEVSRFGADPTFHEHPSTDSAVVARLRAAGAVIVAKTNMLEFAYGAVHPDIGQTNNPHDLGRTSGGSSGGSAALVAAGLVPAAVGTDTGGSIRIPAAYCGIVGMKPSLGLIDLAGALPLSWTLDHAGPMAARVDDARLLLAALAGQRFDATPVQARGLRLGVIAAHRDAACITPDMRRAFDAACTRLTRAGAVLGDVAIPDLAHVSDALMLILLPEALAVHAGRLARAPERMAPGTRLQLEAGAAIPALAHVRARQLRTRLRACVAALFAGCDALISPTVPYEAPAEDPPMDDGGGSDEMLCTALANLVGFPALSLPCGLSASRLPLGLHVMAGPGQDSRLLAIAAAIEATLVA